MRHATCCTFILLVSLLSLGCRGDPCAELKACCEAVNEDVEESSANCDLYEKMDAEVCEDLQVAVVTDATPGQLPAECDF